VNDLTNQLGDCHNDITSYTTQINNFKVKLSTAETTLNEEKAKTKNALEHPNCPEKRATADDCYQWIRPFQSKFDDLEEQRDNARRELKT